MKYIEPPTKRNSKYTPPPGKPPEHFWIRTLLALGTIAVLIIILEILK